MKEIEIYNYRIDAIPEGQMKRIDLTDLCFGKIADPVCYLLSKVSQKEQNKINSIVCVDSQLKIYNDANGSRH